MNIPKTYQHFLQVMDTVNIDTYQYNIILVKIIDQDSGLSIIVINRISFT